ncbi:MAG: hypothetical protein P1P88_18980 [Bacteroidales bacterium]|nr:hypothetical protein [Bacteroidales bacterium]
MKTNYLLIIMLFLFIYSCDFRKSVNKDLITGMTSVGNGLSCEDVYLSVGEEKINRKTFTYGENIVWNFDGVDGFKKTGNFSFPGMQMTVTDSKKDTVINYSDLYAEKDAGVDLSPLLLTSFLTMANPIHSNNNYTIYIKIWDKKGEGTFTATMDFEVVPDKAIEIEKNILSYNELYLFSEERKKVIIGDEARLNEKIYFIIEGLEGFTEQDGKVYIGMNMKATDASNTVLLDETDMLGNEAYDPADLKSQVLGNFLFRDPATKNPVTCELEVWDKKGEGKLKAKVMLNIK